MILLDPDLDPHRRANTTQGLSSPESRKRERDARLPSIRTLNAFLREAQAAVRLKGMVSVLLTTDGAIQRLNRDFRRKNKATDVLSFPAAKISRGEVAGDMAVSVDTARRQAQEQGHPLGIEIKVLMLHGLLHLAGYDHEMDDGEMARRERRLRARLGLPSGLIERVESSPGPQVRGTGGSRLSGGPSLATEKRRKDGARQVRGGASKRATAGPSTVRRAKSALRSAQDDSVRVRNDSGRMKLRPKRRVGA